MYQHSLKRILVVALLAGGLTLASASQAQAASFEPSQGVWQWLSRVWEEGVAVLWEGRGASGDDIHEKAGVCIDPNGCAPHSMAPAGGLACRAWSEAGVCIDPNG
jgi:hypothetical protein